ncbi:transmembrane protein [Pimephales promelas]|nr:transmembrane protein [Pimephales promelas]
MNVIKGGVFTPGALWNHDIKNPDISVDWNGVLGAIAGFQFCTHVNDTDAPLQEDSPRMVEHADTTNISTSTSHVSLLVPLVFTGDVPDETVISATMLGSQLGIKGAAAKASVNISLLLRTDVPNNQTAGPRSCLHFTALTHVLPHTPSPPECPVAEDVDKNASPVRRTVAVESNKRNSPHCFGLEFKSDPHLTVLLTKDEKALCRYHLLLVSVALLVVCILMSLCGSCSSRSRSYQRSDLQKESLLSP